MPLMPPRGYKLPLPTKQDVGDVLMSAAGFLPEPVQQAAFAAEPYALDIADALFGQSETQAGDIPGTPAGMPIAQGAVWGGSPMARYVYTQAIKKAKQFPGLAKALRKTAPGKRGVRGHELVEEVSPEAKAVVQHMAERTGKQYKIHGEYLPPKGGVGRVGVVRGAGKTVEATAHEGIAHRVFPELTPIQRQSIRNAPTHPRARGYKGPDQANESFAYGLEEILSGQTFTGSSRLKQSIEEILYGAMGQ